ncbi:MAG: hypothetical protein RL678_322 [Pseudomonadota bacterium]|jgi:hypothetical protein
MARRIALTISSGAIFLARQVQAYTLIDCLATNIFSCIEKNQYSLRRVPTEHVPQVFEAFLAVHR